MATQFDKLQAQFRCYFESEFSTSEDDSAVNRSVRAEAISLLAKALTKGNVVLADRVLQLLAENTGCAEDVNLFNELAMPLIESGALTQVQADRVLQTEEIGRWK